MDRKKICEVCLVPKHLRTSCEFCKAWQVTNGKWKLYIIWILRDGIKRFSDFEKLMVDISPKVLTEQLRELEADGIVSRTVYEESPIRVEYELTPLGKEFLQISEKMAEIGKQIPFPDDK